MKRLLKSQVNCEPALRGQALSQALFLRLLALIYLIAFFSAGKQIVGLIGREGILPAQEFLPFYRERMGFKALFLLPTIFWASQDDLFFQLVCLAGMMTALLALTSFPIRSVYALLYFLYLSIVTAGLDFFKHIWYPWDSLLLEAGFLAIFLAPTREERRLKTSPPFSLTFLFRWLLFRVLFTSGIMKLISNDPSWRNLTALQFYYETQPLPTWISWYLHQLPLSFHKVSSLLILLIEILVPFFSFGPPFLRLVAFFLIVPSQLLISLTGNFSFFNYLVIILSLFLLEDCFLEKILPRKFLKGYASPLKKGGRKKALPGLAVFLVALSVISFFWYLGLGRGATQPFLVPIRLAASYRIVNVYSFFPVMLTRRAEVIVEGSEDRHHWKAYEFYFKPGDLHKKPEFTAPYHPRLDWQFWLAPLSRCERELWLQRFMNRLLEGSPSVLKLLKSTPFPHKPPRYLRATLYHYSFAKKEKEKREKIWWEREKIAPFCPVIEKK